MQVTSYSAAAVVQGQQPSSPRDPGALIAADVAVQRGEAPRQAERHCGDGHGHERRHRDRSHDESERSHHRMNRLGRALNRLMSAQEGVSASANVLVAGPAASQSGVQVSITAERVYGLYTDLAAGQGPWSQAGDAPWADQISILADRVENVNTAGGTDSVSIVARRVEGISTGNDSDALAIVADVVRNILTDAQGVWGDRDAADAVAIAARLVDGVATGGGDDAIAILGGTVVEIHAQDGNDALSVKADLVGGIYGGAGDDAIGVDAVIGRRMAPDPLDNEGLDPGEDVTLAARMLSAVAWGAHVDGGAGNDAISVAVQATIGVAGGTGDDAIALQGGTVGLFYALGDGHDSVALGAGTEAMVQLAEDIGPFTIEIAEDSLTLRLGEGSITFTGLANAGAIGLRQGAGGVMLLHPGVAGSLDITA